MKREGERDELEPWMAEALDALSVPEPRDAFRAKLKREFVGEARAIEAARPRFAKLLYWTGGALATAAIVLVFFLLGKDELPRLRLLESAPEHLLVDGAPFAPERTPADGARLETRDHAVCIRIDDVFVVELAEETRAVLRLVGDERAEYVLELELGAVRVVTCAGFAPRKLSVAAPDARVEVVGTEFGVDVIDSMGTCVCCTEGSVAIEPKGASPARIVAGEMIFCFREGGEPMAGPVKSSHAEPIEALRRLR